MLLAISCVTRAVKLEQPDDLRSLKVVFSGAGDPAAALGPLGQLDPDGAHAWLRVDELRRLAGARPASRDWCERFDAMVAFADRHGWVRDRAVRAHCERAG